MVALAILQGLGLDLPFIIVSGVIEEDIAVSAMRAGAHDYLSKGKLDRLIPAVEREMRRQTAEQDAAILRKLGTTDDLDELVAWSVAHAAVED